MRPLIVKIKGEHDVRNRCVNVHHIAENQRTTFVTTKNAGGELPCNPEVVDVTSVDLVKLRIALTIVVTTRMNPLIRVILKLQKFLVRQGNARESQNGRSYKRRFKDALHSGIFLPIRIYIFSQPKKWTD